MGTDPEITVSTVNSLSTHLFLLMLHLHGEAGRDLPVCSTDVAVRFERSRLKRDSLPARQSRDGWSLPTLTPQRQPSTEEKPGYFDEFPVADGGSSPEHIMTHVRRCDRRSIDAVKAATAEN